MVPDAALPTDKEFGHARKGKPSRIVMLALVLNLCWLPMDPRPVAAVQVAPPVSDARFSPPAQFATLRGSAPAIRDPRGAGEPARRAARQAEMQTAERSLGHPARCWRFCQRLCRQQGVVPYWVCMAACVPACIRFLPVAEPL